MGIPENWAGKCVPVLTASHINKELKCQHHYHLVESWCPKYIATERRCTPTIVSKQYWGDDICAACRERQQPSNHPWAKLIRRPESRAAPHATVPAR
ncbi:hypothetical protein THARTR1_08951 [Trichoderma harzianum]|uniref:Uncharacterized protein n=1 Tax=Trichoderma harzianum TaxID=5544 RepID=A0A2K0TXS9_TRIHA|nr:hypothetical protein THARTR1_08951 [Trichoderma harzianum]